MKALALVVMPPGIKTSVSTSCADNINSFCKSDQSGVAAISA